MRVFWIWMLFWGLCPAGWSWAQPILAKIELTDGQIFDFARVETNTMFLRPIPKKGGAIVTWYVPDLTISEATKDRIDRFRNFPRLLSGIILKRNQCFIGVDFDSIKRVLQLPDGQFEIQLLDKPAILDDDFAKTEYAGLNIAEKTVRGYPTPEKIIIKEGEKEQEVELKQVQSIDSIMYTSDFERHGWRGLFRPFQAIVTLLDGSKVSGLNAWIIERQIEGITYHTGYTSYDYRSIVTKLGAAKVFIPFAILNEIRFSPGRFQAFPTPEYSLDGRIPEDWDPGDYLMLEKDYGIILVPFTQISRVHFKQLIKFDQYDSFGEYPRLNIWIRDRLGVEHILVWAHTVSQISGITWPTNSQALTFNIPGQSGRRSFWLSSIKKIARPKEGLCDVVLQNDERFRAYWVKNNPTMYGHESGEEILVGKENYHGAEILFHISCKDILEFKVSNVEEYQAYVNKVLVDCLAGKPSARLIFENGSTVDAKFVFIEDGEGVWAGRFGYPRLVDKCLVWTNQAPTENINSAGVKENFQEAIPLSEIAEINFTNQIGIQGCPIIIITFSDGRVEKRSLVMYSESHWGKDYYGMMGNDQVIAFLPEQITSLMISFPLSQIKAIRYK